MKAFLKGIAAAAVVTALAAGVLSLVTQSSQNAFTEKSSVRL